MVNTVPDVYWLAWCGDLLIRYVRYSYLNHVLPTEAIAGALYPPTCLLTAGCWWSCDLISYNSSICPFCTHLWICCWCGSFCMFRDCFYFCSSCTVQLHELQCMVLLSCWALRCLSVSSKVRGCVAHFAILQDIWSSPKRAKPAGFPFIIRIITQAGSLHKCSPVCYAGRFSMQWVPVVDSWHEQARFFQSKVTIDCSLLVAHLAHWARHVHSYSYHLITCHRCTSAEGIL